MKIINELFSEDNIYRFLLAFTILLIVYSGYVEVKERKAIEKRFKRIETILDICHEEVCYEN